MPIFDEIHPKTVAEFDGWKKYLVQGTGFDHVTEIRKSINGVITYAKRYYYNRALAGQEDLVIDLYYPEADLLHEHFEKTTPAQAIVPLRPSIPLRPILPATPIRPLQPSTPLTPLPPSTPLRPITPQPPATVTPTAPHSYVGGSSLSRGGGIFIPPLSRGKAYIKRTVIKSCKAQLKECKEEQKALQREIKSLQGKRIRKKKRAKKRRKTTKRKKKNAGKKEA